VKTAFITGITGQDGSYLAELLLEKGYKVIGLKRRTSLICTDRIDQFYNHQNFKLEYFDLNDVGSVYRLLLQHKPDEFYNLAAQSHVKVSFELPENTVDGIAMGTMRLLEAIRNVHPTCKFYQASSSEMFGNSVDSDGTQRITTPMNPVSPYGCSKLLGFHLVRHYRNAYKLHACNGILFNHESPRRGSNFVTNKVVKTAIEIKKGYKNALVLGNLDSYRDWGHSKDYVRAMHSIINHDKPDDFIVSTGVTKSVRELCIYVFDKLGMNYENYVKQDPKFMRPEELKYLKGDSSKAREILGWSPEYTFESMLDEMIEEWDKKIN